MLSQESEDEIRSRFAFELAIWLWQDELNPRVRCAFGNVCTSTSKRKILSLPFSQSFMFYLFQSLSRTCNSMQSWLSKRKVSSIPKERKTRIYHMPCFDFQVWMLLITERWYVFPINSVQNLIWIWPLDRKIMNIQILQRLKPETFLIFDQNYEKIRLNPQKAMTKDKK